MPTETEIRVFTTWSVIAETGHVWAGALWVKLMMSALTMPAGPTEPDREKVMLLHWQC